MPAKKNIKETSEEGALQIFFCVLGAKLRADLSRAKKSVPKARFSRVLGKLPWLCNISSLFAATSSSRKKFFFSPSPPPILRERGGGGEQSKALKKLELEEEAQRKKKILTSPPFPAQGKKNIQGEKNAEEVGESDIG